MKQYFILRENVYVWGETLFITDNIVGYHEVCPTMTKRKSKKNLTLGEFIWITNC